MSESNPSRRRVRANREGTVGKRADGRIEVRFWHREDDGRWVRRSYYRPHGGERFRTETEAKAWLRQLQRNADRGAPTPKGSTTLADFLADWIGEHQQSLKLQSRRRYAQIVRDYLVPALGKRRLVDLGPRDLDTFYAARRRAGLSPATVRLCHFVLHRALADAERWGKLDRNPADRVDMKRLAKASKERDPDADLADQARRVLVAAQGDRLEALFALAVTAGLRRGELLGLRWDAVDLTKGVINVRYTLNPDGSLGWPKSDSSRRPVPVADYVIAALQRHRAHQAEERQAARDHWHEPVLPVVLRDGRPGTPLTGGLVFTTAFGGPLPPIALGRAWGSLLGRAGLAHVPFHDSRHMAASLMEEANVPIKARAARLGHSSAVLTLDTYTETSEAQLRKAAHDVERVLGLKRLLASAAGVN